MYLKLNHHVVLCSFINGIDDSEMEECQLKTSRLNMRQPIEFQNPKKGM